MLYFFAFGPREKWSENTSSRAKSEARAKGRRTTSFPGSDLPAPGSEKMRDPRNDVGRRCGVCSHPIFPSTRMQKTPISFRSYRNAVFHLFSAGKRNVAAEHSSGRRREETAHGHYRGIQKGSSEMAFELVNLFRFCSVYVVID